MAAQRAIRMRHAGQRHGPITRLISPGDIGQLTKPFVFLDFIEAPGGAGPRFGFHPHSGIATLTSPFTADTEHETSTGRLDRVHRGGLEWVVAGSASGTGRVRSEATRSVASSYGSPCRPGWNWPNRRRSSSSRTGCRNRVR